MEIGLTLSQLKTQELKRLHLLKNRSWISKRDLEKALKEDGRKVSDDSVSALADEAGLHSFGDNKFTTPEIHQAERAVIASAIARKNETTHHINPEVLERVLSQNPTLRDEQAGLVRHIAQGGGVVAGIGAAGTGKTFTMNVAKQAFEEDGREVLGISPSGAAAIELEKSSGIKSQTSFRLYAEFQAGRLSVNEKTTIFYDEAGMADSKSLARVVDIAHKTGAQVVVIGDSGQFEAVSTASLFDRLCKETDAAEMIEIARQKDPKKQEISKDFYNQKGSDAVQKMSDLGMIHEGNPDEIKDALVRDYLEYKSTEKTALALASTNADVKELNDRIVGGLVENGQLNPDESINAQVVASNGALEDLTIYKDEQIMFRMSNSKAEVVNGDIAVVKEFTEKGFIAEVQRDEESFDTEVDLESYKHIQPAYAMTSHKSQGATVDKAFAAPDVGLVDSRALYVISTRGREGVELYTPEGSLEQLKKSAGKTNTKTSTVDQYTDTEKQEFDQYIKSIEGREALLPEPENENHHYDELKTSEEYNRLKREADFPETKSLRDLAIRAGGRLEAPESGHPKRQAERFGIGAKSEGRTNAFLGLIDEDLSPIGELREGADFEDIRTYSKTKDSEKKSSALPEINKFSEREFFNKDLKGIVDAHRTAIIERTKSAQEYQSAVDGVYKRAGFPNRESRNNAQASWAGEKYRGEASLLTQNTRDYMLSLQEGKFGSGRQSFSKYVSGHDALWMKQHEKMECFRDAQEERYARNTPESLLEYKHAEMMQKWSTDIDRGKGGTMSENQQAWRDIEQAIKDDKKALEALIKGGNSTDFAEKTGVVISSDGSVYFASDMTPQERRAALQQDRDERISNPHTASVEYQRDPEGYMKKLAAEEAQKEADAANDTEEDEEDFDGSVNDQVGIAPSVSEREQIEREREEEDKRKDEEQGADNDPEPTAKDPKDEEIEAEAERQRQEEEQLAQEANQAEQDRLDKEDQDREAQEESGDQERKSKEDQERLEEEQRIKEESDAEQERLDKENQDQETQDESEQQDQKNQEDLGRQEDLDHQEEEERTQEEIDTEQDRAQQENEEQEQQEIKDEINNPESNSEQEEIDRKEREEEAQRIDEDLNQQEGMAQQEGADQDDMDRQQQDINDDIERQEMEEEEAQNQAQEERMAEEQSQQEAESEEALSEEYDQPEMDDADRARAEEEAKEDQKIHDEIINGEKDAEQAEPLSQEELDTIDRSVEQQDADNGHEGQSEEDQARYQEKLDQEAENNKAYNEENGINTETSPSEDAENEALKAELEAAEQERQAKESEQEQDRKRREAEQDKGEEKEIGY